MSSDREELHRKLDQMRDNLTADGSIPISATAAAHEARRSHQKYQQIRQALLVQATTGAAVTKADVDTLHIAALRARVASAIYVQYGEP